jgi:CHAT domain-containing protein/tetratricopeptide (TPR) repeat protein
MQVRVTLLFILFVQVLSGQSPFQFREASLLIGRMVRSGRELYENRLHLGRDQITETDVSLLRGDFQAAENGYKGMLSTFRQQEGPTGTDLAWMLDHVGRSYLEVRDFDRAYQYFFQAVAIRRSNIESFSKDPKQAAQLETCRAHLLRLLIQIARLDAAKGDLARASQEFAETTGLANRYVRLEDADAALYFRSLFLERAGKWNEAETMWQEAAKKREKMTLSDPYWDMLKDMAGFYARHGDFHAAADLVKRIQTETEGKTLRPEMEVPAIPDWYSRGADVKTRSYFFKEESDAAMADILSVDRWLTDGAEVASSMISTKGFGGATLDEDHSLIRGSDSDRARVLEFLNARMFLRISVLLDGEPSPERVAKAYESIREVKGGYLKTIADITTGSEADRNNPSVSYSSNVGTPVMLDELADLRMRHAHMFVNAVLYGGASHQEEFAKIEQSEQALIEMLGNEKGLRVPGKQAIDSFLTADEAAVDITAWERIDRASPSQSHREYGAFVSRKGQPTKYIRMGPADVIDRDVAALEGSVAGSKTRGVNVAARSTAVSADLTNQLLKQLYQEVISPLEGSLNGVRKLVILTDGKLTLAPINAFIDSRGQYLHERYTISYTGYDVLGHAPDSRGPNKTTAPVVIANPDFDALLGSSTAGTAGTMPIRFEALPATALEANDVLQALHLPADRVLTGKFASEAAVRSIGGPEILHFATHSIPDLGRKAPNLSYDLFEYPTNGALQNPLLQSVIALSGANRPQTGPEDGLLTGLEIASLRLYGTKLVVLSTCEAGQGTAVDGQGVLGLRSAFAMAGAQGLVMSLWPVDDQAGRRFMQFFYAHLGAGPAEAVRMAQFDMVAKTEYKQPRYWAGYVYSGTPSLKLQAAGGEHEAEAGKRFAKPTCLEVTMRGESGHYTGNTTYRVKIGGDVHLSSSEPERVVYDLLPPSSDLEESTTISSDHGQPLRSSDSMPATLHNFPVSLTIERTKDHSAVYVREYVAEGDQRYKPQTMLTITLKGGPALFPSFDIPSAFPPLSGYTEASVSHGSDSAAPINGIGACIAP